MPNVLNEFAGDGVTRTFTFSMTGGYLSRDYVYFYTRLNEDSLSYTPYDDANVTWVGDFTVELSAPIPNGTTFVIVRSTPLAPLVDFQNTSRITEKNLDTATQQSVHIAAEASDTVGRIQVIAQDAKQESAQALADTQAAAASANKAAASAIAASSAATAAQATSIQAGANAEAAALSASTAAAVADAATLTVNAANATAISAAADAASALASAGNANATANSAASQASTAVNTANTAVSTANAASAAAGNAVTTASSASATASTALALANEAKDLVDEAVSGAVVSFNGRVGVVTPQSDDYTKAMVGLGNVDNTADTDKPVSTAQQVALDSKVDKVAGKGLSSNDFTNTERVKLTDIAEQATKNATDAALRVRSTHTGTQGVETITGLSGALATRVVKTSDTGAAILPEGTDVERPAPGPTGLYVRLSNTSGTPEWYNRAKSEWQPFGDAGHLATQLGVVDAQVQALDANTGFTIIYPNGGSAVQPANVVINTRYVMNNPFPGFHVITEVELLINGEWGPPGFIFDRGGFGVAAHPCTNLTTDTIVVSTGSRALCSISSFAGTSLLLETDITTPTPCRVKVWKLKGGS